LVVQRVTEYNICDWEPEGQEVRVRPERVPVRFAVGSTQYRVDECDGHAGQAMGLLTQLTAIATRLDGKVQRHTSRSPAAPVGHAPRNADHRRQTQEVRRWVQKNFPNRKISDRGRIPYDLVEEYNKAHK
jgi:hypothetical protein